MQRRSNKGRFRIKLRVWKKSFSKEIREEKTPKPLPTTTEVQGSRRAEQLQGQTQVNF